MPTYTDNFGFAKPIINSYEEEDQWGEILNSTLDAIDEEIGGKRVQSISSDTTAAPFTYYVTTDSLTLTLPGSPSLGDWLRISNLSGTTTGTVARNGSNIMGLDEDMKLDVQYAGFTLTYTGEEKGWAIT